MRKTLLLLLILLFPLPSFAVGPLRKQGEEPIVRELHVPFDALNVLLQDRKSVV